MPNFKYPNNYDDDFINTFKKVLDYLNSMGYTYEESLQKARRILEEAKQTNDMNESVQQQINTLIAESGTSDAEVLQARIDAGGNEYPVLKDRLDESDSQLAQTMNYLNEFGVNVRKNGAIGDGVTDDTQAIQDTIDYVASVGGGTVYIPDYVFIITASLKMKSNVKIVGNGTIKCQGIFPSGTSLESSAINIRDNAVQLENVVVDGLTIYAPEITDGGEGRGIYISWAKNISVRNNVVKNADDSGIRIDGYGETYGVLAGRGESSSDYPVFTENIYVENNKIFDVLNGHGIEAIAYPSDVIVSANKVYNASQHGIRMSGVYNAIVSDNIINSAGEFGVYLAGYSISCLNNNVDGKGVGKYGIRMLELHDSLVTKNIVSNVTLSGISASARDLPIKSVTISDNEIFSFGLSDLSVFGIFIRNEGTENCVIKGNRIIATGTSPRGINLSKWDDTQTTEPNNNVIEGNIVSVPSTTKIEVKNLIQNGGTNLMRDNLNLDSMKLFESNKGVHLSSGSGSKLVRIPHNLNGTPTNYSVTTASADAGNSEINYVTSNVTYLDVNFKTALPTGTDNIKLVWECNL